MQEETTRDSTWPEPPPPLQTILSPSPWAGFHEGPPAERMARIYARLHERREPGVYPSASGFTFPKGPIDEVPARALDDYVVVCDIPPESAEKAAYEYRQYTVHPKDSEIHLEEK